MSGCLTAEEGFEIVASQFGKWFQLTATRDFIELETEHSHCNVLIACSWPMYWYETKYATEGRGKAFIVEELDAGRLVWIVEDDWISKFLEDSFWDESHSQFQAQPRLFGPFVAREDGKYALVSNE